jgi:hypothetical protein
MRTFFIGKVFFIHFFILVSVLIAWKAALNVIWVHILARYCVIIVISPRRSDLLIVATASYVHRMSFQVALKRYALIIEVILL